MFVGFDLGLSFVSLSFIVATLIIILCLSLRSINNTKKMTSSTETFSTNSEVNTDDTQLSKNAAHDHEATKLVPSDSTDSSATTTTSTTNQVSTSCTNIGWKRRSPEGVQDDLNESPSKKQSPNKEKHGVKDLNHPVYKSISLKNGQINQMTQQQLKSMLSQLKLDTRGYPDVLKKRLKTYFSHKSLDKAGLEISQTPQHYDYLCVIDFEATCERVNSEDYLHEIIEFPIVLVNTKTKQVEDTFMSFCKPLLNPKLSDFCTHLTNISQTQVDYADSFPIVLERVKRWMKEKELGSKYTYAVVTDGPWDMNMFLRVQCKISEVKFPPFAKKWINLSKTFSNFYKTSRVKLELMLKNLGYKFEGNPHRGIDDAKNIARIAIKLMEDGCDLVINDWLT